jgi:hypothetical protein
LAGVPAFSDEEPLFGESLPFDDEPDELSDDETFSFVPDESLDDPEVSDDDSAVVEGLASLDGVDSLAAVRLSFL